MMTLWTHLGLKSEMKAGQHCCITENHTGLFVQPWCNIVQYCTLYGTATHIANARYRTTLDKMGEFGPLSQSNKVSDSINYHLIKHHLVVQYSTSRKR